MKLQKFSPILISALVASTLFVAPAFSASPVLFPSYTAIVTVGGAPVQGDKLRSSIVFDDVNQMYHIWTLDSTLTMAGITHATSPDGVTFTSSGGLTVPTSWWTALGATAEPSVEFIRADKVGSSWFLTIWTPNEATAGVYGYNSTVWQLGNNVDGSPNNTLTQFGPLPSGTDTPVGPGGTHTGSFGIVNNTFFLKKDTGLAGIGAFTYMNPASVARPILSPTGNLGIGDPDLFTGTSYTSATHYVHNAGRVQAQSGTVGAYYSFRDMSGAKVDNSIWYVESSDGGNTWSTPVDGYAGAGAAMQVLGATNSNLFSHPEVTSDLHLFFSSGAGTCTDAGTGAVLLTAPAPRIDATFAPASISVGDTTTLTITLTAPDVATGATACGLTAPAALFTSAGFNAPLTLPTGLTLASVPVLTGTGCTVGSTSGTVGGNTFGVSGYSIAPGAVCTLSFDVQASAPLTGTSTVVPARSGASNVFINNLNIPATRDATAALTVSAKATATSVPTLSAGSLMALTGLIGLFAAFLARRKRSL